MNLSEIAAIALDEWVAEAEDATSTDPKSSKPIGGEAAQGVNAAKKDPNSQSVDLQAHDQSRHGGHFDPATMSCKFRDKMAETMAAMGTLDVNSPIAQQLGEHAIKVGCKAAGKAESSGEIDEGLKNIRELNKKRRAIADKNSEEYKQAKAELDNARDAYLKEKLSEAECGAVDKLVEKAKEPTFRERVKAFVDKIRDAVQKAKEQNQPAPITEVQEVAVEKIEENGLADESNKDNADVATESEAEAEQAEKNRRKSRQELSDKAAAAEQEYEDAVRDKKSADDIFAAQQRMQEAKQMLDERMDNPDREDLLEDLDNARAELDDAKGALDELKAIDPDTGKPKGDEKEIANAEEAVAQAEEKVNSAKEAFNNYQEPQQEQGNDDRQEGGNASAAYSGERNREFTINGKEYVDVSDMGFLEGLGASIKAGFEGKDIITDWDKMCGRWNQLKASDPKFASSLKNLQQATAGVTAKNGLASMIAERLKDKKLTSDERMALVAAQDAINNGESSQKVYDHLQKALAAIRKSNDAHEESQRKQQQSDAKTRQMEVATQLSQDKAENDRLHKESQRQLAQAKFEYQKKKDEGQRLDKTAAENNPELISHLQEVIDKIGDKNKHKADVLKQLVANLQSEASKDPSKAVQWTEKADVVINGKPKDGDANIAGANEEWTYVPDGDQVHENGGCLLAPKAGKVAALDNLPNIGGTAATGIDANKGIQSISDRISQDFQGLQSCIGSFQSSNVTKNNSETIFSAPITKNLPKGAQSISELQKALRRDIDPQTVVRENGKNVEVIVPNQTVGTVSFKNMLGPRSDGTNPWKEIVDKEGGLQAAVGLNDDGSIAHINLAKPNTAHLFVVGQTGMGKTQGLLSLMNSMMVTYGPDEVQFDIIDPKGTDFMAYTGMKNGHVRDVVPASQAKEKLLWYVNEMESRYNYLKKNGAKDLSAYNTMVGDQVDAKGNKLKMPHLVLTCDEVADLRSAGDKTVDKLFARLAAKGRAAGIHLFLGTQRADRTHSIPGFIQGNISQRIIFGTQNRKETEMATSLYGPAQSAALAHEITAPGTFYIGMSGSAKSFKKGRAAYMGGNNEVTEAIADQFKGATTAPAPQPSTPPDGGSTSSSASVPAAPAAPAAPTPQPSAEAQLPQDIPSTPVAQRLVKAFNNAKSPELKAAYAAALKRLGGGNSK